LGGRVKTTRQFGGKKMAPSGKSLSRWHHHQAEADSGESFGERLPMLAGLMIVKPPFSNDGAGVENSIWFTI